MKHVFILLMLLASSSLFAQLSIKGKVVDEKGNNIEFVEAILLSSDTIGLKSQLANENGEFEILAEKGSYILQVQQLSKVLYFKAFELNENIDLGIIKSQNTLELEEIVVSGKMKVLQRKVDRMVFSIENTTKSSEGNALGVLRKTPGVKVQNDMLSMVGKSEMRVLVNDKLVQLKGEELINFLTSIPSEDIKNIEIITTPPAKYEALGNSGLVNIVLKEAKRNSWNALLGSSYHRNSLNGGGLMGNFNYNKNKLSLSASASVNKGGYYTDQEDFSYFDDALWYVDSPFEFKHERLNLRLSLDYQISPKWTMGGQYLYNYSYNVITDSPYLPVNENETNNLLQYFSSESVIDQTPKLHSVNWNTSYQIDSLGKSFTVNLDYFNFDNPDSRDYSGVSVITAPYSLSHFAGLNVNQQQVKNYAGKIDFDVPTNLVKLSFGGKFSLFDSNNDISAFNSGFVEEVVTDFPLVENKFSYKENVGAIYVSASKQLTEKLEAQVGLRMEATYSSTASENLSTKTENNYIKFFPSLHLSYVPNEKIDYSLGYSRRIDRPSFNALNPNQYFVNPFQTLEGNPFLQPAYIDNVEFAVTYRGLSSSIYFSYEDNLFGQVPLADPSTNFIRYTNENYMNHTRVGITESYVYDEIKWWTSSNSVNINYLISKSMLESSTTDERRGINAQITSYNDFTLDKKGNLLLDIGGWFTFPRLKGIYKFKSIGAVSAGIQWLLMDKNLKISVKGNDLFHTQKYDLSSTVNGVFQRGIYYYDSQSLHVAISYKFGNKKLKVKLNQGGNQEERGRTD